jgi:hypothetical protein
MEIVAEGYCTDCEATVGVDFDDESGAAYCVSCGSYEVEEVTTDETDDDDDSIGLFDDPDDEEDEDGLILDDEF